MSQDTTDSEAVEKCGAKTASGTPCQNPADSCPHHSEGNNAKEESPTEIPDENSFRDLAGYIIDISDFTPKDGDSPATQAAKAWVDHNDGGTDLYRSVFGGCDEEGCSYGANGFEADYCRRHQQADGDDSSGKGESGDGVSVDDLTQDQKEQLLKELLQD